MAFDREISDEMIHALNLEYEKGKDGWWSKLVDHDDTLIAIRDKYLNVYYNGCNVAKVEFKNKKLKASIHYKYLLKKNLSKNKNTYIEQKGDEFEIASHADLFITSLSDFDDIKSSTNAYGGIEKIGVHQIIRANLNILDTEIALSKSNADSENKNSENNNSRIDFCAIQEEDEKLKLRFFEAKHYSNKALKAKENDAKVISQLNRYRDMLIEQNDDILSAYKKLIPRISDIKGSNILGKDWGKNLNIDKLELDHEPRLVIFGFDNDQKNGDLFKKHMEKLRQATGKKRLLLKGDAKGFTSGISS